MLNFICIMYYIYYIVVMGGPTKENDANCK